MEGEGETTAHGPGMSVPAAPRPRPCASCPYRRNVPSGVWEAEEYDKLPRYDLPTGEQPVAMFMCHQGDESGHVCAGCLGHADPTQLLAVRIAVISGAADISCTEYATTVPLFASGTEAAEHGRREIESPTPAAQNVIEKLTASRARTGKPVH